MSSPVAFLWLDMETTGLDPQVDQILEFACVFTDSDLVSIGGRLEVIVKPRFPLVLLEDAFAMHARSGLLELLPGGDSLAEAEDHLVMQLECMGGFDVGLAGSSPRLDYEFLRRHMPRAFALLHYRCFDVRVLQMAYAAWVGVLPKKESAHRAMADVEAAIEVAHSFKLLFSKLQFHA